MMSISSMCNDKIRLLKTNGDEHEVLALVQDKLIFVSNTSVPIEEGDIFERDIPNGIKEVYEVINPKYFGTSIGGMQPHYQINVRKVLKNNKESKVKGDLGHEIHVTGNNSPVIINSKDNYTNVSISGINDENVFEELKKCISKNVDGANKEKLLSSVDDLEKAKGSNGYTKALKSFVQIAKDGMTIIGPFIPYLVSYIT